jgi:hypothetical protein
MKKLTCVLAILAAASTAAVAKDLKQDQKNSAPAVSATQMSDAEMDRVTAGAPGNGVGTANDHTGAVLNAQFGGLITAQDHSQNNPGFGVCTAGRPTC